MRKRTVAAVLLAGVVVCLLVWRFVFHGQPLAVILFPPPDERAPAVLDKRVSVDFRDKPLRVALAELAELHDAPIELDLSALAMEGYTGDEPVNLSVKGVSLRSALNLLARHVGFDLTATTRGERIVVTTDDDIKDKLDYYQCRTYSLSRLLDAPDPPDVGMLIRAITTVVEPHSWEDMGGAGRMEATPAAIIVSNTEPVQRKVAQLLDALARSADQPEQTAAIAICEPAQDGANAAIRAALIRPAEFDYDKMPLADVAADIEQRYGIEVALDVQALAELGVAETTPVTVKLPRAPLHAALRQMFNQLNWAPLGSLSRTRRIGYANYAIVEADPQDGVLLITTTAKLEAAQRLTIIAYPVSDLLNSGGEVDVDTLIAGLTRTVAPGSWEEVGGLGAIDHFGNALLIAQTPHTHRRIEQFLSGLRTALKSNDVAISPATSAAAEERNRRILGERVTLHSQDAPLGQVVEEISRKYEFPITLDVPALNEIGVGPKTLVSVSADNARLEDALRWMLRPLDLTLLLYGDLVLVSTPEECEASLKVRFYPVGELADFDGLALPDLTGYDFDSLIELITSTIAPDQWDEVGGPGAGEVFGDVLFFAQTDEIHDQIEQLLRGLHYLHRNPSHTAAITLGSQTPGEPGLFEKLQRPARVKFVDESLTTVAARLSEQFGVAFRIDERALDDLGIDPETRVTTRAGAWPWQWAARGFNFDVRLSLKNWAGAVWITTPEDAEGDLVTRLYPVSDLLIADDRRKSLNPLNDAIMECVAPSTWDQVGGPGSIKIYETSSGATIVASQTLDVHQQIEVLLVKLRELRQLPESTKPLVVEDRWESFHHRMERILDDSAASLESSLDRLLEDNGIRLHWSDWWDFDRGRAGEGWNAPLGALLAFNTETETTFKPPWNQLLLTSVDQTSPPSEVRIYPIGDLRALIKTEPVAEPLLIKPHWEYWQRPTVPQFFEPPKHRLAALVAGGVTKSWVQTGGRGRIAGFGDVLVIAQTRHDHRQIERLLERLRGLLLGNDTPLADADRALLQTPIDLSCSNMPLQNVLRDVAQRYNLPIWLDHAAFYEAETTPELKISCKAAGEPIADVIRRLASAPRLEVLVERGVLFVTTEVAAARRMQTRVYDLRPLLAEYPEWSVDDVQRIAMRIAAPWAWQNEGDAPMNVFGPLLVVREREQKQAIVAGLMDLLAAPPADLPRPIELARDDNRQQIERVLAVLRGAEDDDKRAYAAALLFENRQLTARDLAVLSELLAREAPTHRQHELQLQLLASMASRGHLNDEVLPPISTLVGRDPDPDWDPLLIRTIPRVGVKPEALAAALLRMAVEKEDAAALRVLIKVDPRLEKSHEVIAGWRNSESAETRRLGDRAAEVLQDAFRQLSEPESSQHE